MCGIYGIIKFGEQNFAREDLAFCPAGKQNSEKFRNIEILKISPKSV